MPITERIYFILASYDDKYSTEIHNMPYNYHNIKGCRNLGFKLFSEREHEDLLLYPPGCIHTSNDLFVRINLFECPPGFVRTKATCTCNEKLLVITGHEDLCNIDTGLIKSPINGWINLYLIVTKVTWVSCVTQTVLLLYVTIVMAHG